jgi:hypothetical protein
VLAERIEGAGSGEGGGGDLMANRWDCLKRFGGWFTTISTSSENMRRNALKNGVSMEWQAVAGMDEGSLISERPRAKPNPAVEVLETLPDGTEFKAVWSHLRQSGVAKLVTVHFFD